MALEKQNPATSRTGYPEGTQATMFKNIAAISTNSPSAVFPSHYSTEGCGGLIEVPDLESRNSIPVDPQYGQGAGNIMTSGRRSVGMLVHVVEEAKLYKLIPKGFWGNDGDLTQTEWANLGVSQEDGNFLRASLLSPGVVYKYDDENGLLETFEITNVSTDSTMVVTCPGHSFSNGDKVEITEVEGNTNANNNPYYPWEISDATENSFKLSAGNNGSTTPGGTYTKGGKATKVEAKAKQIYYHNGDRYTLDMTCSGSAFEGECYSGSWSITDPSTTNPELNGVQTPLPNLDQNSDNECWVELEIEGGATDAYVNGVENKPGAFSSVHQTGSAAPAIWGDKTFVNSYLHIKHDADIQNNPGGEDQISDPNLDAALQVDRRVTVGTSEDDIFSVKENTINLHSIVNIKNVPHFSAGTIPPVAGVSSANVNGTAVLLNSGDLYSYTNSDNHKILGIVD